MRTIIRTILAAGTLVSGACASMNIKTDATSMRDPSWEGTQPTHIMVFMSHHDLKVRRTTETTFEEVAEGNATTFIAASRLFFPDRDYSAEEIQAILDEHEISGIMAIYEGDAGTDKTVQRNPFQSVNTNCKGTAYNTNCRTTVNGADSWTWEQPWAKYELRLFHHGHNDAIWIANIETRDISGIGTWNQIRTMLARRTLEQLAKDGVIGPPMSGSGS